MSDQQKTMAVVGAGVIGLSWARLARSHGWRVGITDPRDDLDAVVRAAFGADDSDVFTSHTLADVVAEADLVRRTALNAWPSNASCSASFSNQRPSTPCWPRPVLRLGRPSSPTTSALVTG